MAKELSQMVETKLTRSEMIDIIIDQTLQELDKEEAEINATLERDLEEIGDSIKIPADFTLPKPQFNRYDRRVAILHVEFPIPKAIQTKLKKLNENHLLARQRIRQARYELQNRTAARLKVLTKLLQVTPEGTELLEAIKSMKISFKQTLLDGAAREVKTRAICGFTAKE